MGDDFWTDNLAPLSRCERKRNAWTCRSWWDAATRFVVTWWLLGTVISIVGVLLMLGLAALGSLGG